MRRRVGVDARRGAAPAHPHSPTALSSACCAVRPPPRSRLAVAHTASPQARGVDLPSPRPCSAPTGASKTAGPRAGPAARGGERAQPPPLESDPSRWAQRQSVVWNFATSIGSVRRSRLPTSEGRSPARHFCAGGSLVMEPRYSAFARYRSCFKLSGFTVRRPIPLAFHFGDRFDLTSNSVPTAVRIVGGEFSRVLSITP